VRLPLCKAAEASGIVGVGVQWSEGDSWPVGERAEGAGTVGDVEHKDKVDKRLSNGKVKPMKAFLSGLGGHANDKKGTQTG